MGIELNILECCPQASVVSIERDATGVPVLRNVKIAGTSSDNGRDYAPEAYVDAIQLYEGAPCNLDHPDKNNPGAFRSVYDRFGKYVNVRPCPDGGLRADLLYNPEHPRALQVEWFARNQPDVLAFSHNAVGDARMMPNGRWLVYKIKKVNSVDIVADGGTTISLFESVGNPTMSNIIERWFLEASAGGTNDYSLKEQNPEVPPVGGISMGDAGSELGAGMGGDKEDPLAAALGTMEMGGIDPMGGVDPMMEMGSHEGAEKGVGGLGLSGANDEKLVEQNWRDQLSALLASVTQDSNPADILKKLDSIRPLIESTLSSDEPMKGGGGDDDTTPNSDDKAKKDETIKESVDHQAQFAEFAKSNPFAMQLLESKVTAERTNRQKAKIASLAKQYGLPSSVLTPGLVTGLCSITDDAVLEQSVRELAGHNHQQMLLEGANGHSSTAANGNGNLDADRKAFFAQMKTPSRAPLQFE